jgi:myo-inositol 2-dehydrogenase/D-chiro-inositol 1-dehydrogenase
MKKINRRSFIKQSSFAAAGAFAAPAILSSKISGMSISANDKINVGVIGCGRIARGHDIPLTLTQDSARIVAVCDVDKWRMEDGKKLVEKLYLEKTGKDKFVDVKMYSDFRDLCSDKDIDAVILSTPDHWHAIPAIEAARCGKDIYLQKPASLTIEEGRVLSDTVNRTGRILQIGSQQRSLDPWPQFHRACELVLNGRIGEIQSIKIGLPGDPGGDEEPEMPIPSNLDYDLWLGSTPYVYYTEKRVHPQHDYSRPGWLRCEQFGAGMITGWGAHHVDTAHWGMGTEYTGPVEIEAEAEFPKSGLWNVHGDFNVWAKYENGVDMHISGKNPNGVRFEGTDGWIFVSRGSVKVTSSDPTSPDVELKALDSSDPKILDSKIGQNEIRLYKSEEQHLNWLNSIRTRRQPIATAEIGHRSCSACLLSHIAMKLPRKLYWDPMNERFKNDDEANSMLSRPMRLPWRKYFK